MTYRRRYKTAQRYDFNRENKSRRCRGGWITTESKFSVKEINGKCEICDGIGEAAVQGNANRTRL